MKTKTMPSAEKENFCGWHCSIWFNPNELPRHVWPFTIQDFFALISKYCEGFSSGLVHKTLLVKQRLQQEPA